jgi:2-oxo-4-hydroxy-4-carboxy--5-ureidoimidazoline (OHCU) decarboxylase
MASYYLPSIIEVPKLSTTERASVLDALFEPCTALHTLSVDLLHTKGFETYNDLIASVGVQLTELSKSSSTSDTEWLDKILGAHPRLGEKKVESAQSQAEQAQLNTGGVEEADKLRSLNEDYERKFPGLKYVYCERIWFAISFELTSSSVFVNGRPRPVIMANMQQRITRGDIDLERAEAIKVRLNQGHYSLRFANSHDLEGNV